MSVDALKQVLPHARRDEHNPPVSPGLQLILVAIAWLTRPGSDSTAPITHKDIARVTYQAPRSIRRLILEGISIGALEVVWARPGQGARYRINRGDWHIPIDAAELEAMVAKLATVGEQQTLANMAGDLANLDNPQAKLAGSGGQFGPPLKKEERKKEKGLAVLETRNPEMFARLREKGHLK